MARHKSESFTPPQRYVCRRCGHKGDDVAFALNGASSADQGRLTMNVDALCSKCDAPLDKCGITVMFVCKGVWTVNKSHVG